MLCSYPDKHDFFYQILATYNNDSQASYYGWESSSYMVWNF